MTSTRLVETTNDYDEKIVLDTLTGREFPIDAGASWQGSDGRYHTAYITGISGRFIALDNGMSFPPDSLWVEVL